MRRFGSERHEGLDAKEKEKREREKKSGRFTEMHIQTVSTRLLLTMQLFLFHGHRRLSNESFNAHSSLVRKQHTFCVFTRTTERRSRGAAYNASLCARKIRRRTRRAVIITCVLLQTGISVAQRVLQPVQRRARQRVERKGCHRTEAAPGRPLKTNTIRSHVTFHRCPISPSLINPESCCDVATKNSDRPRICYH